ncbi:hypothetical protein [Bacillus kexueae]|uniref:hypothetical protein n=1 Tax=Aeribacillus kexueae TaxID=2078952 RepID=UPI001FAF224A|nr:hypothetical protein [Bacillus kexueae]
MNMEFLSLLLSVAICLYLVLDAPKYNKNPWLWGILGFIFGLITLGIYFIQTDRKSTGWVILIISILYWIFMSFVMISLVTLYSFY